MTENVDRHNSPEELTAAKNGDEKKLAEIVESNMGLVKSIALKFLRRGVANGTEYDDLVQIGTIGMIKAVKNFDPSYDCLFSTYAVPMIIGEIRRYLRDNNAVRVSRSIKDIAYRAMQVKEQLTNKLNREPTVSEIAKELDIPSRDVVIALESVVDPISLYEPIYSDGGDTIYVLDQVGDNNDDRNWLEEISFREAIKNLSEREKKILSLRFIKGKTQMEVSEEIGISQAQVSRLEKFALEKIKN